jgi:hypothetical protein
MYIRADNGEQALPAMHPIAALQGASGDVIQELLRRFVERWAISCRLAGVVERRTEAAEAARKTTRLQSVSDGETFPLFQDLGAGATGCCLDSVGPVQAGEAVSRHIADGCDLVVLNKFGKLEAESHAGLLAAFVSAVEHNVPVLTAVSPKYEAAWSSFASPFFTFLPPEDTAIDQWWRTIRAVH